MSAVAFSSDPEIRTLAALQAALGRYGYFVSQKSRLLDVVEAAAANPVASTVPGPSIGDELIPGLRAAAGPFSPQHPWLRPGDWDYAFKAHFDFVVHAPLSDRHATHPLFAVEFDGPGHSEPGAMARDVRKNRLCLASGLQLVRVDSTYLYERDRLSLIEWLATLFAAYRRRMPELLAGRDAEIDAMDPADIEAAGPFLFGERPDLDVDLIFRLENPFPPAQRLARHLADRYGFSCRMLEARPEQPQWRVGPLSPPLPSLSDGLTETWTSWLEMHGPGDRTLKVSAMVELRTGYPIDLSGEVEDLLTAFSAGRVPCLPAGPWFGAPNTIGPALCDYNLLREVSLALAAVSRD